MSAPPTPRRYLAFGYDPGGWNNILMQFEIVVLLAWLTRRTLILPPPAKLYLLGSAELAFEDFLDLDALQRHLPIVRAADFHPKGARYDTFHDWMTEQGHSPSWDALRDVWIHPPNGIALRPDLIPRLCGRRPIGNSQAEEACPILYLPSSLEHRLFGIFEAFFLFADPLEQRRARTLVRDAIRYRPDLLDLAVSAISDSRLAEQHFSSMHIRRGEFQQKATRISPGEILRHTHNLLPPGAAVYLATDESDPEFLRPFRERFALTTWHDLPGEVIEAAPYHWIGILETLICAAAPGRFIGTRLSTFSSRIATLRGYLSCAPVGPAHGIDTALYYTQPMLEGQEPGTPRPYGVPRQKHKDEFGETATPWWESIAREPLWGRTYQSIWAETTAPLVPGVEPIRIIP